MTGSGVSLRDRGRRAVKLALKAYTLPTSGVRSLPDFLIIGAQRCGTTSLYRYLVQHPRVAPAVLEKGVHYFDTKFDKGVSWYRAHFVSSFYKEHWSRRHDGQTLITGEASPYYVFHPLAAGRIAELLPEARLILMLRDPVKRAYSHYQHEVARAFEHLPFEEALRREPERLEGEAERMEADPGYYSFNHQHYSYLARGRYLEQLRRWHSVFPREQILIINSEEFFAEPDRAYRQVLAFLRLEDRSLHKYQKLNARAYPDMAPETKAYLKEYFAIHNSSLSAYLGTDLGWSS